MSRCNECGEEIAGRPVDDPRQPPMEPPMGALCRECAISAYDEAEEWLLFHLEELRRERGRDLGSGTKKGRVPRKVAIDAAVGCAPGKERLL